VAIFFVQSTEPELAGLVVAAGEASPGADAEVEALDGAD
jgi:hypothetical protein